jgi:hypothetical protein
VLRLFPPLWIARSKKAKIAVCQDIATGLRPSLLTSLAVSALPSDSWHLLGLQPYAATSAKEFTNF